MHSSSARSGGEAKLFPQTTVAEEKQDTRLSHRVPLDRRREAQSPFCVMAEEDRLDTSVITVGILAHRTSQQHKPKRPPRLDKLLFPGKRFESRGHDNMTT